MKFLKIVASLLLVEIINAEEYLVRLKSPKSLTKFMESKIGDMSLKSFVSTRISKTFSFGKFEGFTADFPKDFVEKLKKNPLVADVVPNSVFNVFDQKEQIAEEYSRRYKVQEDAPRHLARLSRRGPLPYSEEDGWYQEFNYYYDRKHRGDSVNAYIIDTGIYKQHKDLGGRAYFGADMVGEGPGDYNGHGTHVAGIVGSRTFGVAKKVNLVEVKALNAKGQGNLTSVISSIEFSVNHCKKSGMLCVANLSLGSLRNTVLNQAVEAAVESGLVVVVAAGNSNVNACWNSPASAVSAITVGAFDDRTDTIAKFSNWGMCVDVFASGVKVMSLSNMPPFKPVAYSGTSMASPSVAGLAAVLLDSGIDPPDIKQKIIDLATENVFQKRTLVFKPGTPNRIAFNGVRKEDDIFEEAVYPVVDINELVKELENYKNGPSDGNVSEDDVTLPLGEIKLTKRNGRRYSVLSPDIWEPTFSQLQDIVM